MQIFDQNFTTAGDFTNSGVLSLQSDSASVEFRVNGTLTDYSPTTHTLGGDWGNYNLNTDTTLAAILRFNNADIVTNDAQISLIGQNANILDQNGNNGLRDFAVNGASGQFFIDAAATSPPAAISPMPACSMSSAIPGEAHPPPSPSPAV